MKYCIGYCKWFIHAHYYICILFQKVNLIRNINVSNQVSFNPSPPVTCDYMKLFQQLANDKDANKFRMDKIKFYITFSFKK